MSDTKGHEMEPTFKPVPPIPRDDMVDVLTAMQKQIALLSWHVKSLQGDGWSVTEEIDSGMRKIDNAMRVLIEK